VTVLPPRPLPCSLEEAWDQLHTGLQTVQPFEVELTDVRIFAVTQVIHLALGKGAAELVTLHEQLGRGCLEHQETYFYHPHVTLAQFLPAKDLLAATQRAIECWQEYQAPRSFILDRLTLVQNTNCNQWMNLRDYVLRTPVAA
jgi:2'-5' RNA ligase